MKQKNNSLWLSLSLFGAIILTIKNRDMIEICLKELQFAKKYWRNYEQERYKKILKAH